MSYLQRVIKETKTRFWVNNPTIADSQTSLESGAFACTTNPAYCSKLYQMAPDFIGGIVKDVVARNDQSSPLSEQVYHLAAAEIMKVFLPLYEKTGGKAGFVTIQEDPRREHEHDYIVEASKRAAKLNKNFMAKIPVTAPGLIAIKEMVALNIPICATEIFSLSQAVALVETYEEACRKTGNRPEIFITHITGIMDDYFGSLAKSEKLDISLEALKQAGTIIAKKEYKYLEEAGYAGRMLGGGARGPQHFTEFVGGDMHITINWSTAVELNANNTDPVDAIDNEADPAVVKALMEKLPNFKRSYDEDGMKPEEFEDYGPTMLFRTQFLNGYSRLIDAIELAKKQC
ncbi:MAG: transaldolase family protein [Christensenellales bacterium]|jgi:transaldolase